VRRPLVLAALLWPFLLAAALASRAAGAHTVWSDAVYLAASRVCHQRPDRSFFLGGAQWPVCGRCAGLYLAAPIGALVAWWWRGRTGDVRWWLGLAAVPTAVTLAAEWSGAWPVTSAWRAAAGAPLGAVVAFVLVRTAPDRWRPIG
jgi:uncharacterized membrane protein